MEMDKVGTWEVEDMWGLDEMLSFKGFVGSYEVFYFYKGLKLQI
jgi:hypothetical protein